MTGDGWNYVDVPAVRTALERRWLVHQLVLREFEQPAGAAPGPG
jgi:hypothetical protein